LVHPGKDDRDLQIENQGKGKKSAQFLKVLVAPGQGCPLSEREEVGSGGKGGASTSRGAVLECRSGFQVKSGKRDGKSLEREKRKSSGRCGKRRRLK